MVVELLVLGFVVSSLVFVIVLCTHKKDDYEVIDASPYIQQDRGYIEQVTAKENKDSSIVEANFYLRSTPYTLNTNLLGMGWRKNSAKLMFEIKKGGTSYLLTMAKRDANADYPMLTVEGAQFFEYAMEAFNQHPFIYKSISVEFNFDTAKAFIVRRLVTEGSIKDDMHQSRPMKLYAAKYKQKAMPILQKNIFLYGRQIIEALIFLEGCGYPFSHIHAGNIFVVDDVVKISDVENSFLGLERKNEKIFKQFAKKYRKPSKKANLSVLALGCLVYEMATGRELLNLSEIDNLPEGMPTNVVDTLHYIFHSHLETKQVPTLEQLVEFEHFAKIKLKQNQIIEPIKFEKSERAMMKQLRKSVTKIHGVLLVKKKKKNYNTLKKVDSSDKITNITNVTNTNTNTNITVTNTTNVPPPPPSGLPPPPPPSGPPPPPPSENRGALLGSISGFRKGGLKKAVTNDRSAPILGSD
jgi:PX domain-containing protein kinase-like protein